MELQLVMPSSPQGQMAVTHYSMGFLKSLSPKFNEFRILLSCVLLGQNDGNILPRIHWLSITRHILIKTKPNLWQVAAEVLRKPLPVWWNCAAVSLRNTDSLESDTSGLKLYICNYLYHIDVYYILVYN